MSYSKGINYVEVKDKRYSIHPSEKIILKLRDPPQSLRIQYRAQRETEIKRNQKVLKKDNDEMIVKNYLKKKKANIQQPKYNWTKCLGCKWNNCFAFDKGWFCQICEFIINKTAG